MRLFGFEIKRAPALQSVDDSRGWLNVWDSRYPNSFQTDTRVDPVRAQQNWTVFACQTLIAGDIAKLGIDLVMWNASTQIYEKVASPSFSPVLRKPNGFQTWQQYIEFWVLSKVQWGNTYVLLHRDDRNVVYRKTVLDPAKVKPLISESGEVYYELGEDHLAQVDRIATVPASEILHDRMNCLFHPLVGVSPLYACALAAAQGLEIQGSQKTFFENMSRPSGFLTAPAKISDATAARLKSEWETNYGGKNTGRTAVLGDGLEYKAMTQNAVDSELVAQSRMSAEMICSAFHVPPYKVGVGPAPTYQNAEVLNQIYYDVCLQPLLQGIESVIEEGLGLPKLGYSVRFNLDDLLRMDSLTQMEFVSKGVERGVFAPNEGRRRFNMKPVKGGESPMIQQQNYSLAALAKRDAKEDPFATAKPPAPAAPAAPPPDPETEKVAGLHMTKLMAGLRLAA